MLVRAEPWQINFLHVAFGASWLFQALYRGEQILQKECRQRGTAGEPGLGINRARVFTHGALAARPDGGDLLSAQAFEQKQGDFQIAQHEQMIVALAFVYAQQQRDADTGHHHRRDRQQFQQQLRGREIRLFD